MYQNAKGIFPFSGIFNIFKANPQKNIQTIRQNLQMKVQMVIGQVQKSSERLLYVSFLTRCIESAFFETALALLRLYDNSPKKVLKHFF